MRLEGKAAIITGAGNGMGKAMALLFAKEGAKVAVADVNEEWAQAVANEIREAGGTAIAVAGDVSKEEDVGNLFDTTVSEFGTVDILINNAGIMDNFAAAGDVDDTRWEKIFAVNVTGVMRTTRRALKIFQNQESGSIVNISSVGGIGGGRAGAAYTASKHAVMGFSKSTAYMYADSGIRCNVIAPGGVETNISSTFGQIDSFGMGQSRKGHESNPRSGKPEEIATVALFLASDEASFVNGAIVTADAGWTAY